MPRLRDAPAAAPIGRAELAPWNVARALKRGAELLLDELPGVHSGGAAPVSTAISGHQRSSVIISGHQWSSVIINGHQWSSMVISCTHLSESKCCLRAVVSLSVRSSAKMVDTFGEASSAFRTSPAGTGVHEDIGVNVNAGMGSSYGPMVSSRARGARGPGIGNSRDTAPSGQRTPSRATMGQSRHQGQSRGN